MKKIIMLFVVALLIISCVKTASPNVASEDIKTAPTVATQPVAASRLYGIGSVSKVFTAAAVMKLVDDGRIDLDRPLAFYIPEFRMADSRYAEITPRMLLNHSSGLMGTTGDNGMLMGDNDTYNHDHFLSFLTEQTLKHKPGDLSVYSNDGFTLAEILVEHVSGISFTEFIGWNFFEKLGLENVKTPQSNFDRERLAAAYIGSSEMKHENVNAIGAGGIYATMEDLCRYSTIFMGYADDSVLSKESTDEMAKNQHRKQMVGENADTVVAYGLGWDSVNTYPFNQYGIQALSKGGTTGVYHTNLSVLPEYNLAVAVASSGQGGKEQLIAQEIILEILKEEGLISDTTLVMPDLNTSRAQIPEAIKSYAGLYAIGMTGLAQVEFSGSIMTITPIGVRNERPHEYIYNTDGEFVSSNGDYINMGFVSAQDGTRGVTTLKFTKDKYIVTQTYVVSPGLSQTAMTMPVAEKIEPHMISAAVTQAWEARNNKEYLLVSEKYSSFQYVIESLAKINTDARAPGYVGMGIYKGNGGSIKDAKIIDENTAVGFQSTPTMAGRDTNSLNFNTQNGVEVLAINNYRYIDAASIEGTSTIGESVKINSGAVWFDVDGETNGKSWRVKSTGNGSWFTYDDKMNCVATSLEKNPRDVIILPQNGRIVFVGEAGTQFEIIK
jgi:CubicO group peptidase (beta-lactamase class C family)